MPAFFLVFHGGALARQPDFSGLRGDVAGSLSSCARGLVFLDEKQKEIKFFIEECCNLCVYGAIKKSKPS